MIYSPASEAKSNLVLFNGHHSYIVSIARLCKENNVFTDVVINCDNGKISAHRSVKMIDYNFKRGNYTF